MPGGGIPYECCPAKTKAKAKAKAKAKGSLLLHSLLYASLHKAREVSSQVDIRMHQPILQIQLTKCERSNNENLSTARRTALVDNVQSSARFRHDQMGSAQEVVVKTKLESAQEVVVTSKLHSAQGTIMINNCKAQEQLAYGLLVYLPSICQDQILVEPVYLPLQVLLAVQNEAQHPECCVGIQE